MRESEVQYAFPNGYPEQRHLFGFVRESDPRGKAEEIHCTFPDSASAPAMSTPSPCGRREVDQCRLLPQGESPRANLLRESRCPQFMPWWVQCAKEITTNAFARIVRSALWWNALPNRTANRTPARKLMSANSAKHGIPPNLGSCGPANAVAEKHS